MENNLLNAKKSRFGVSEAALATFLFVLYNVMFVQFVIGILPKSFRMHEATGFVASFLLESLFAVAAWSAALVRRTDIVKASGIRKKFNAKIVWYGFLISVVSIVGFGNITNVFLEFLSLLGYKQQLSSLDMTYFWQYLVYVVVFCATPAFCEELLFRGTILAGLKQYGMKIALIVSSLIFTLMHGNAEQTVHQFIIGVLVGYLFIKTGNLWLGVIVHFFNNFISVTTTYVMMLLTKGETTVQAAESSSLNPWTQLVFSALFAIAFAYFGFQILKYLIKLLFAEEKKLNEVVSSTAVISVDGAEIETKMEIEGASQSEGASAEISENAENIKKEEKEQLSVSTIVLFTLSCSYLALEWLASLLVGLGVI